jgi:hypothetical protein
MTNKLAKKLNDLSISNLKDVLNVIDGVLSVFEKHDGKKITKRIENDLKEVSDYLYLTIRKDCCDVKNINLSFYFEKRSVFGEEEGEYKPAHYIANISYCLLDFQAETVDYESIKKRLENVRIRIENKIDNMIETERNIDRIKSERARLIKELSDLMDGVDYETARYFNLRTEKVFS